MFSISYLHKDKLRFRIVLYLAILGNLFIIAACSTKPDAICCSVSTPQHISQKHIRKTVPTLADYWAGLAEFSLDQATTGLPMGESDTLLLDNGEMWSYVHASYESANVHDSCGTPVEFPGCVIRHTSQDQGKTFAPFIKPAAEHPICLLNCLSCPCESQRDHIDQQQYPQIVRYATPLGKTSWIMVYEYRATVFLRRSTNGLRWTLPASVPLTGIWQRWLASCHSAETIQPHPHLPDFYECLVGGPPGLFIVGDELYIFMGFGQNPGSMGCYRGPLYGPTSLFRKCEHNPLFTGADQYGPADLQGPAANVYFDFRTISSADVLQVGDRYYMLYEGVRGPVAGDAGDTQFGLGLARSITTEIDGPWEEFPDNPILVDLPGNVGLGHADLIMVDGQTVLYTSLDGVTRSRLILTWVDR